MEEEFIKAELHGWIDEANGRQLHDIYELMIDYFNHNSGSWDDLPEYQRARILQGLAEAEAGLGWPAKDVIEETRRKYNLNK